jgi:hypothetical protein
VKRDPREYIDDGTEAVLGAAQDAVQQHWTSVQAKLVSWDAKEHKAVLQPLVKGTIRTSSGDIKRVELPQLKDVPINFTQGGGSIMTLPLKEGDEMTVVLQSRSIDNWWEQGGTQPQATSRVQNLSDGIAMPGTRSKKNAEKVYKTNKEEAEWRTENRKGRMAMHPETGNATHVVKEKATTSDSEQDKETDGRVEHTTKAQEFTRKAVKEGGQSSITLTKTPDLLKRVYTAAGKVAEKLQTATQFMSKVGNVQRLLNEAGNYFTGGQVKHDMVDIGKTHKHFLIGRMGMTDVPTENVGGGGGGGGGIPSMGSLGGTGSSTTPQSVMNADNAPFAFGQFQGTQAVADGADFAMIGRYLNLVRVKRVAAGHFEVQMDQPSPWGDENYRVSITSELPIGVVKISPTVFQMIAEAFVNPAQIAFEVWP